MQMLPVYEEHWKIQFLSPTITTRIILENFVNILISMILLTPTESGFLRVSEIQILRSSLSHSYAHSSLRLT